MSSEGFETYASHWIGRWAAHVNHGWFLSVIWLQVNETWWFQKTPTNKTLELESERKNMIQFLYRIDLQIYYGKRNNICIYEYIVLSTLDVLTCKQLNSKY